MSNENRGTWGSNIGFLMAAIGSAVGLGNIWGFPYKMGANGGFAFLLVYLIIAVFVGFVIMVSELAIGRKTGQGAVGAYLNLSKKFKWVGWLSFVAPALIMTFYAVLGAYCLEYMCLNLADVAFVSLGSSGMNGGEIFGTMLTNPAGCAIFTLFFMASCLLIVKGGIKGGIEKFNVIAMPALFIMLVIIVIRSVTLPGAVEGLKFMFMPNLEPLKEDFIGVLAVAGSQCFFSLSLAMGITITYGSYLSKKESLVKNSLIVVISDTVVALMAGLAVLPASFALGGEGAELAGPKLLFVTLQDVFAAMGWVGSIFGVIFYLLVFVAALSSAIALTEVLVTFFIDHAHAKLKKPNRKKITAWICFFITLGALLVAVDGLGSNGVWVPFKETFASIDPVTGETVYAAWNDCWLDFMDAWSEGIAMPLGALLMSLMIGWEIKPKTIIEEIEQEGIVCKCKGFYSFCIKFVVPVAMTLILLGQIDGFFGLGIF
ncbi:MAG: sodium-dependent transporter [Bacillota bacterium]|jgi:NSS family neurotransmitter:Na+ symporter